AEFALKTTTARCPTVAWKRKRGLFFKRTSLLTAVASSRASSVDRFLPALRSTSLSPSTVAKPARSARSPSWKSTPAPIDSTTPLERWICKGSYPRSEKTPASLSGAIPLQIHLSRGVVESIGAGVDFHDG